MFTGIIEATGYIERSQSKGKDLVLTIGSAQLDLADVSLGDSIAVNGVCLTVVALTAKSFQADVSAESLAHTHIGSYGAGTRVNLEKALKLSSRLGGHLVSGHVDGLGKILKASQDGRSIRFDVQCPKSLEKYIAEKGSIAVDGVSLTVTGVADGLFALNIVPHTVTGTIIDSYQKGQVVHLEVDLIARYTERLLTVGRQDAASNSSKLDVAFLSDHGFLK